MVRRIVDELNDEPDIEEARDDATDPQEDDVEAAADDADPDEDDQDDDQEDDDETPTGDEDEQPATRQARREPTRAERAIAETRRRAQEAERREHELALENARLRGGRTNEPESPAVRNARLAAMEPTERVEYLLNEERQERQRERQSDRFEAWDRQDRAMFDERARTNNSYARNAGEVERRLQLARAQGQNVPRETILKFLLGERMLASRTSPKTKKQREEAARRVDKQRVRPSSGKGERGGRSGPKSADLEKRLENVPI